MAKKEGFKGERAVTVPLSIVQVLKTDFFGKDLHITHIGYYPQADLHYIERKTEEANQFVLIYCIDGEGWFEIDRKRQHVVGHQFFILPKGKAHKYGSSRQQPWTIYWMHFDGEKASFFAKGFDKPTEISPNSHSRIQERIQLFEEIFNTLSKNLTMNNIYYSITSLFHFLGSMKFRGEYCDSIELVSKKKDQVDELIHYMHENIEQQLTLDQLAKLSGLSASHLSLLFQRKTSCSPLQYLKHLRIQKACQLLDYTDMKIIQISPKVGFGDALYFTRIFKKETGLSPKEYRSLKKG
ncbi:MAG: AraC family transcriptional regulator [Bacteroidales bacterium 45-6]|nr:MAG: AraC family transcriptional regulator [Bacteroidales bacterium 45-6]